MSAERDHTAGVETVPAPPRSIIPAATMMEKVFIALPWQKQTNPMTAFCVSQLMERRRSVTCLNFGDAFVAHSRNTCADLFLKSNADWMLMIDDDMLVPFGNPDWFNAYAGIALPREAAGLNALDRLLSHKKTLVGALYFGRHTHGAAMYSEGATVPQEAKYARSAPLNVVKPTKWVATGCMLVHRSVFEAIEKRFPRLARGKDGMGGHWFTASEHNLIERVEAATKMLNSGTLDGEKAYQVKGILDAALAEANRTSSLGMGEDVQFCARAAQAGHQAHVDLGLVCGHIGHMVYGPWNTRPRA